MVCKHCGRYIEKNENVCPFCGHLTGCKNENNTKLIVLLISLCAIFVITIVVFVACAVCGVFSGSQTHIYEYDDVVNEQIETIPAKNDQKSAVVEKPQITFSGEIGVVNGVLYAGDHIGYQKGENGYNTEKTEKSIIPILPVEGYTNNGYSWIVSGFTYYDGYIYYMLSYPQSPMNESRLYRCKSDFSEQEFIGGSNYDFFTGEVTGEFSGAATNFVVCDDVLYFVLAEYDLSGDFKVPSVDLKTMQIADRDFPDITGCVYNDVAFEKAATGNGGYHLYMNDNGEKTKLGNELTFIWGFDGEYVYYSNPAGDGTHANLYKANVNTGDEEFIDCKSSAKDGTPYFCF